MSRSEYHAWAIKANRNRHSLPSLFLSIPTDPIRQTFCESTTTDHTTVLPSSKQKHITLPVELMFEILNHLLNAGEQGSLYNASLVSRHWMNCATPLLFRHPKIHNTYRWATFLLTLIRPNQQYTFGEFVRSINLSSSYESSENNETSNSEPSDTSDLLDVLDNTVDRWENVETPNINISNSKITPTITLSTSSFLQVASRCPNLTFLDLSNTALFCDSLILETGEYVSSIQTFALQPGLTHVRIDLDQAIRALGTQCPTLRHVNLQSCDWVTAKVIWCWVVNCPKLQKLDARRCLRCGIERLTNATLDITSREGNREMQSMLSKQAETLGDGMIQPAHGDPEESIWTNPLIAEYSVPTPSSVFSRDNSRQRLSPGRAAQPQLPITPDQGLETDSSLQQRTQTSSAVPITLRILVYEILKDAKISGINDVNWLHDE
ncbi:unnamed protein product [Umbelopsis vinacea]